jgi:hypothetical protein
MYAVSTADSHWVTGRRYLRMALLEEADSPANKKAERLAA